MQAAWPEPVERVAVFLRTSGAEARLEQLGEGVPTARAAADAVGCARHEIVTSLVLMCGDAAIVALVPGDRSGDPLKVARLSGAQTARPANPDEVVTATGFQHGAVAPFPLPGGTRVLLEHTLLSSPVVWVGGGSDRHLVALAPTELLRLTRGEAVDLVQESA